MARFHGRPEGNIPFTAEEEVAKDAQEKEFAEALPLIRVYENRVQYYPRIGDQLDMLWHGMNDGVLPKVDSFYDALKAIKDKYPKE